MEYAKECFREWVESADCQDNVARGENDNGHRSGGQESATSRGMAGRQSALPVGVINARLSQSRVVAARGECRCRSHPLPQPSSVSCWASRGKCNLFSRVTRLDQTLAELTVRPDLTCPDHCLVCFGLPSVVAATRCRSSKRMLMSRPSVAAAH